jgi:YgiT-type zinc finger domain-containing protein
VSEVFTLEGGRRVLVEHIPAQVCERCGEPTFSRETTEKIRQLVHGAAQPRTTVPLEVFGLT